ncbi:MAG: hypothetical protein QOK37_490 [Thermoanaerobaculia bacterium]|jgi:hypothetical protein|nr:hypothetical protein [Thermoanaerobaculia bacterium]
MTMKRVMMFFALTSVALTVAAQKPAKPQAPIPATPQPVAPAAPVPATPPAVPGHFDGVASCANSGCHGSTQPLNAAPVLQNEYYTWLSNDRHAQAYNVLFSDRSARVARNMHLKGKAYQEAVCLDCHSTNVASRLVSGKVDIEDGVQCEACHGPASGWRAEHTMAGWTHEQSVARGMVDLRNLPTRASGCISCHLGNDKKEVDHELIASGHPILAFELDNYTETMPPHWRRGKDTRSAETHGARAFAVGQAAAFSQSLDNLARHAKGEKWPEFSDMSCINCHHSLESSGWRQERGWPGRAGLPAWSPQHWAVLRLLVGRASSTARAQLDSDVQLIASRVGRMNDTSGVAQAAADARRVIDGVTPQIAALSWRDDDVRTLMRTITGDTDFILTSDVHSAEQSALALQSLASVLTRNNPKLLKSPMTDAIDALFAEIQNRERYEPSRFVQKLTALRAAL